MSEGQPIQRKASIVATVSAVVWSFFGVRRGADHEKDMASLNPVVVIVVGILLAVVFVVSLIAVVKLVLAR
jgi:hypothetical protein